MWAGAPNCYMDMLDTFRNEYVGLLVQYLLVSLEPLGHRKNIASLYLFYRYYFGRCSSKLAELVQLPYSRG